MPYLFLGTTGLSYTQYLDTTAGRMLQAQPGGTYDMQPVPGAGGLPVPPGDGLWGPHTAPEQPADQPDSAPPGAHDQPAPKGGKTTKPAAPAAPEG